MRYNDIIKHLNSNDIDDLICAINVAESPKQAKDRYLDLLAKTNEMHGDGDYILVSASGRSEIGGNHTDHQHGKVIAAAVNVDNIAFAKPNNSMVVDYRTIGYDVKPVDLSDLSIKEEEKFTTESLIKGIAAGFIKFGYKIGGFSGLGQSNVLMGSGISSSASFEVLIAEIFNHLFNEGKVNSIDIAKIAQYSENNYFGKPCGLLDQMAISVGGFVYIDFKDIENPLVEKLDFNFRDYGYNLVLVNTKGDHADLSHEYAAIPSEIKSFANYLNKEVISETSIEEIIDNIPEFRSKFKNDRAILRSLHVINENNRAEEEAIALKNNDIKTLLTLMKESGNSSYKFLQNIYVNNSPYTQNLSLGIAISETILKGNGVVRVHGGGFEGTIQAVVHDEQIKEYINIMSKVFGYDSCYLVGIRSFGGVRII